MHPVHLLHAAPDAIAEALNTLIAEHDVALSLHSITLHDGMVAAVVTESPQARNVPGALIEVQVKETRKAEEWFAGLVAANPYWSVAAAWPVAASGKKKTAGLLVVATLRQP